MVEPARSVIYVRSGRTFPGRGLGKAVNVARIIGHVDLPVDDGHGRHVVGESRVRVQFHGPHEPSCLRIETSHRTSAGPFGTWGIVHAIQPSAVIDHPRCRVVLALGNPYATPGGAIDGIEPVDRIDPPPVAIVDVRIEICAVREIAVQHVSARGGPAENVQGPCLGAVGQIDKDGTSRMRAHLPVGDADGCPLPRAQRDARDRAGISFEVPQI